MTEVVQIAKPGAGRSPAPGDFILTEAASDILRSLALVHEGDAAQFTMIAGAPGVGKTFALRRFAEREARTERVEFKAGEGKPTDVSEVLFQRFLHWQEANGKSLPRRRELLVDACRPICLILADEAQHLTAEGIEWLRGFAEDAGVSVAFVGDLRLDQLVRQIPQLSSRIVRPVVLKRVSARDVQAKAAVWPLLAADTAAILRALEAAAERDGRLRNVDNVLRHAALFAGCRSITAEHARAAIVDLKLDRRRLP